MLLISDTTLHHISVALAIPQETRQALLRELTGTRTSKEFATGLFLGLSIWNFIARGAA